MTDTDFLLKVLSDGRWHGQHEIIQLSQKMRGYGLTVHSRASDLRRKRGLFVEQENRPGRNGRVMSFYRLVPLGEVAPVPQPDPLATSLSGSFPPDATSALSGPSEGVADEPLPVQLALTVPRQEQEILGRGRAASGRRAA